MRFKNLLKNIYYKSPKFVKKIYGYLPLRWKFGKAYFQEQELIKKSYTWNNKQTKRFINEKLIEVVQYSYYHIPFYNKLYKEHNIDIKNFNGIKDMNKLPIINKNMIKNSNYSIKSDKTNKFNSYKTNTGGSSGSPFSFLLPSTHYYRLWAYYTDLWSRRCNYKFGDKILSFRGHKFDDKLFQLQPLYNFYLIDSYKLTKSNINKIISLIKKQNIKYIHGYPSNITNFFELIGEELYNQFDGIFFVSEKLDKQKKEFIRKYTNAKFQPSYDQSEMTILASYGFSTDNYYFYPTFGYPEIVSNGKSITECGVKGELVATSFNNFIMPFIRYKTGDVSSWTENSENVLNNFQSVSSIEGRVGEYIKINGKKISVTGIIYGQHLPIFDFVQNIQLKYDNNILYIYLVTKKEDITENKNKIESTKKIINEILNFKVKINFYLLKRPIKTNTGKAKILLNQKEVNNYNGEIKKI